ncbi:MAG: helix-turn-helix domain-containing protein [Rikenellaceae bacterium]
MSSDHKDYIMEFASNMFAEHGIKSVRMDDIAREAKVSKRTIYEYFGDKEELLYQSCKFFLEQIDEQRIKVASEAPNIVIAVLEASRFTTVNSEKLWRVARGLKKLYPEIHGRLVNRMRDKRLAAFRKNLVIGVEEGFISTNINLDLAISMMHYLATGIIESEDEFLLPEGMSREDAFFQAQVNFMRGISTPKGSELIDDYLKEYKTSISQ